METVLTPQVMYEKLLELYRYVEANGRHPEYREEKFRGSYLETEVKEGLQLTIRCSGNLDRSYGMSYVSIKNLQTEVVKFFYVRDCMTAYEIYLKEDESMRANFKRSHLLQTAYKVFIGN